MNKILIISVLLVMTSGLFAQTQKVVYANSKQIEDFFKTKTMVVMDADPFSGFNRAVTDAVTKYWTITPFEVISNDEFENLRDNPELSFIFQSKVQLGKDKKEVYYMYMNIVMGGKAKNLTTMPELLSIPLAYTGVDEEDYIEKLPLMIRFAQIHINNLKAAKKPKPVFNLKNYSKESQTLKNMTLFVQESDLSAEVNTVERIGGVYRGTVQIVTTEELEKAIEEKTPNIAVLHQISPAADENAGRSYCQIYGAADAKLYYFNHVKITQRRPVGMLARDFRLISGKWF